MSNPSFSNIDRWLFELMEGNLSPEQVEQLEAFLLRHPELDVDRDVWELAKIDKPDVQYAHQQKFIKRRPVGLYMAAGFSSILTFIFIAIQLYLVHPDPLQASDSVLNGRAVAGADQTAASVQDMNMVARQGNSKANADGKMVNSALAAEETLKNRLEELNNELKEARSVIGHLMDLNEQAISVKVSPKIHNEEVGMNTDLSLASEEGLNTIIADNEGSQTAEVLKTKPPGLIELGNSRNWMNASTAQAGKRYSSTDYSESFASKMHKMSRAIGRMLDNPVALKNLKDPVFHIPGMLPADVNLGNTGTLPATRVQTLSRLQWYGLENEQFINQMAVDGYVYAIRGGVGVQASHSYYGGGQILNSNMAVTYSPKFSVSRNVLIEPAIRFKMGNKSLDQDKITGFGSAEMERENVHEFYPGGISPTGSQLWYRDLGLGMMVNTRWFFAGLQVDNLLRHYDNIYSGTSASSRRAGQHVVATIGTDYESKKEQIGLSPYLVYQQKEQLRETWGGLNARFKWLTFGGAVSDNLDFSASAGVKFNRFAMSYQADYLHSAMWDKQLLSHQLSIKFITFNPHKRQKFLTL